MALPDDLAGMARGVIDANRYMTLGTAEPDGGPRVSPVFFSHAGYRTFYWVSSPLARHSANIAARPGVEFVVYDSSVPVGAGRAVYVGATAEEVPAEQLTAACDEAFADTAESGVRQFRPDEVSGDAPLRLYRARPTRYEVHVPGRDPKNETGIDTRREITL
ncbi:pyridoxamine 5'-phosphate oxidase family protein [Streptomyces sp. 184]|uniref:pyridoxamine 5'-phosphate oxidase family protein n=1 Tax=Streptomyces sp. 184 TaxID=1827526 RepID=UPI00389261A3